MTFSRYYRHKLTAQQKAIYDDLVAGMENRVYEVQTNYVSNQDISVIAHAVNFDNPQLFYVDFTRITVIHFMGTSKVLVSYLFDEFLQRKIEQKLKTITSKILNSVAGKTMKAASLILHDWLVCNCKYGECIDVPNASHSIVGALIYSKCVCEGYAKAFQYIMNEVGIDNVIVIGTGTNSMGKTENHAWNYVKLDKKWYAVDVTWDDPMLIGDGIIPEKSKYKYFLKGSKTMNENHFISGKFTDGGQTFTYPTLSVEDYE